MQPRLLTYTLPLVLLLTACSTTPEWNPKRILQDITMLPRADLERQRQLRLARDNHIGWRMQSKQLSMEDASPTTEQLIEELTPILMEYFAEVSVLELAKPVNSDVDFIIDVLMLDTTGDNDPNAEIPKPHTAKMRIKLLDARSQKMIDVITVDAHAGSLIAPIDQADYTEFMQASFRDILEQIVVIQ